MHKEKPCNFPGIGAGKDKPPAIPLKCPKCKADPIDWSLEKIGVAGPPLLRKHDRLGAGRRCKDCDEWFTGPFHFCIPVNNPAKAGLLLQPKKQYTPLIKKILSYSEEYPNESRPELVKKQLDTVANLHRWARYLATRAGKWLARLPPVSEERLQIFTEIEDAIRQQFTHGDSLIPPVEFNEFSGEPDLLQERFEQGWNLLGKLWEKMKQRDKKTLVCNANTGLNHEKGYHHVLTDLKNRAFEYGLISMEEL
jgi:hypothetical protein